MAIPQKKVDRNQIYRDIVSLIKKAPEQEVEVSSSDLADRFGVQPPTMDYHLNKLLEEGLLVVSPQRGRYNRKIYRLPSTEAKNPEPATQIHIPFENEDSQNKFQKFLQEQKKKKENKATAQPQAPVQVPKVEIPVPEVKPEPVQKQPVSKVTVPEKAPEPVEPVQEVVVEPKDLTLDERINQFLQDTDRVHDANVLLGHEDKEILSVMNETIQQNVVYLKDLSEQLSTIQNKQLIQHLIDDRNTMQEDLKRAQQEVLEARELANQTIQKYEINPTRVRNMHQLIADTVDQYVKLPNHAMALGRKDFRNKISKEVGDLVKYVLHLEK